MIEQIGNIKINTGTEIEILEECTQEEFACIYDKFVRSVVQCYWERQVLPKSKNGEYLKGYDTFDENGVPSRLYNLNSTVLKLPHKNWEVAINKLRTQSLTEQYRHLSDLQETCLIATLEGKGLPQINCNLLDLVEQHTTLKNTLKIIEAELLGPKPRKCFLIGLLTYLHQEHKILFSLKTLDEYNILLATGGDGIYLPENRTAGAYLSRSDGMLDKQYLTNFYELIEGVRSVSTIAPHKQQGQYVRWYLASAYTISNLTSQREITLDFTTRIREILTEYIIGKGYPRMRTFIRKSAANTMVNSLEKLWQLDNPEAKPLTKISTKEEIERYFQPYDTPELSLWIPDVKDYFNNTKCVAIRDAFWRLSYLLKFAAAQQISSPSTFIAKNGEQFAEYLSDTSLEKNNTRNSILSDSSKFFTWYYRKHEITSPLPIEFEVLKFNSHAEKAGVSFRNPIPLHTLNRMKEVLTANDFAWAKTLTEDYAVTTDKETNKTVKLWNPVRATALLLLLTFDLRTIGVRTLDSGEFDEYIVGPDGQTLVPNPSPNRIRKRQQGALQLLSGFTVPTLGLHVQPQKLHKAHTIPFVPPEIIIAVKNMIDWQKRFGPTPQLVSLISDPKEGKNDKAYAQAQKIVPLFRDLNRDIGEQAYPMLNARLDKIFAKLCNATELAYPDEVQLTKTTKYKKHKYLAPLYDKHSLRVSINSHLQYIGGLPFADAQKLLNHTTPMMTLYYTKSDLQSQHQRLSEAYGKLKEAGLDPSTIKDTYALNPSEFVADPMLISRVSKSTGIWKLDLSGICPGTSCSEGGPVLERSSNIHGPVPGQRCALCRFRITGPQFLLGLTMEANNILYRLKKSAKRIKSITDEIIENQDNKGLVMDLNQQVEVLNNISNLDWQEWQAIVQIIGECNDRAPKESKALTLGNLHAGLEESSEFGLMHSITTAMGMFPTKETIQNREAVLEKHEMINNLLLQEGVEPYLMRLPEAKRLEAGNMLSSMILNIVPQENVDEITIGRKTLSAFPSLQMKIKQQPELENINN